MEMILEILFSKLWILGEQLDIISRMGRRVIITGNQIRQLARRGRNRLSSMSNRPVILVEEPRLSRESYKRLHTGQLTEEARRLAMYREIVSPQGDHDLYLDCTDDPINGGLTQASNGGNLYGGNGTTGRSNNRASLQNGTGSLDSLDSPDGAYEGLAPAVILANQGWNVYGENGNVETARNGRQMRGNVENSGVRRLLTLGNVSVIDSSDSE